MLEAYHSDESLKFGIEKELMFFFSCPCHRTFLLCMRKKNNGSKEMCYESFMELFEI